MKNLKGLKGQYFSFDAIISSVIFILTIVTLLSHWHSVRSALDFQTNENIREAIRVSDLSFTPGYPANERCSTQSQIGFAVSWQDKRLNYTNLELCASTSSNTLQSNLSSSLKVSIKVENQSVLGSDPYFYIGTNMDDMSDLDRSKLKSISKFRRVATAVNRLGEEQMIYLDFYVYN
ncbi:MAG: hypothetical protein Q7S22_07625 [Candidatus Micrarchaeota archaeon]|nr:hypothetical protein [Candidatus Micrarchaeota archaeon]